MKFPKVEGLLQGVETAEACFKEIKAARKLTAVLALFQALFRDYTKKPWTPEKQPDCVAAELKNVPNGVLPRAFIDFCNKMCA